MSRTFTKLFASITESTIWVAPDPHLRLWVYLLANADQEGNVWGSVPGIANHSRVPIEAVEVALKSFMSPDPYSRTKALEGRRIEEIDGGWHLVNHGKYRAMMHAEERREKNRQYKHDERARKANVSTGQQMSALSAQAEAEAEAEAKAKAVRSNPLAPSAARVDAAKPALELIEDKVVEKIPLCNKTEFEVRQSFVAELDRLYPAVDAVQTLREIRGWCIGNPRRTKTARGVKAFITAWFTREQDKQSRRPT